MLIVMITGLSSLNLDQEIANDNTNDNDDKEFDNIDKDFDSNDFKSYYPKWLTH